MKKTLWSTVAAALFILSLTGCAGTAEPVQTEDRSQTTAEVPTESTAPVESEPVFFSAGDEQPVEDSADGAEDSTASEEPIASTKPDALALTTTPTPQVAAPEEVPASAPATPAQQETPAPAKMVIKFEVTTQKGTEESPSSELSATPEPEPTPTPIPPAESDPPVETTPPALAEPTFSIDYWISYAQSYAGGAGLNLDPTATACWDNPITAGAHCTYLERDIQSRLNRYARDETISDVWIWAEPRTDGSYDFYIGYA